MNHLKLRSQYVTVKHVEPNFFQEEGGSNVKRVIALLLLLVCSFTVLRGCFDNNTVVIGNNNGDKTNGNGNNNGNNSGNGNGVGNKR